MTRPDDEHAAGPGASPVGVLRGRCGAARRCPRGARAAAAIVAPRLAPGWPCPVLLRDGRDHGVYGAGRGAREVGLVARPAQPRRWVVSSCRRRWLVSDPTLSCPSQIPGDARRRMVPRGGFENSAPQGAAIESGSRGRRRTPMCRIARSSLEQVELAEHGPSGASAAARAGQRPSSRSTRPPWPSTGPACSPPRRVIRPPSSVLR